MEKIEVITDKKERLDKYLSTYLDISRALVQKMINNDCILVNNNPAKSSSSIHNGDIIEIVKEYHDEISLEPENIPLDIVYEDNDVILVNKPSGLVVHPGSGNHSGTLVNALLYHTKELSDCDIERPGIVHRIDKDTSGLMLVAKNNQAHAILAEEFKYHRIERKYTALVCGVLKNNHITIDAPIGRDPIHRQQMMVTDKNSKPAITHINVIKRFKEYTLVECILETGRTHQIRVHLSYIGYPIYNDPVYNNRPATAFGQFLHSSEITFCSPITKKQLHFKCPLPEYFQDFIDNLDKEE